SSRLSGAACSSPHAPGALASSAPTRIPRAPKAPRVKRVRATLAFIVALPLASHAAGVAASSHSGGGRAHNGHQRGAAPACPLLPRRSLAAATPQRQSLGQYCADTVVDGVNPATSATRL